MPNEVRIRTSAPGAKQATGEIKSVNDALNNVRAQGAKGPLLAGIAAGATTVAFNALGSAISGVGDFMGTAIGRASDLAESQGKVNVVFGAGAKEVEAWADTAAEAFGQSKQQALEAAGTYGNLFQAFGVGADKSREMSMALVELAADLASFNNTSIEDALIALRSGLSGETEPLKRYGIAISDARMRTELAAEGYKNLGSTLTPLQKSMAAYSLIMKDSSLAQGDFARTADGVANSIRSNEAAIADLEAEIGTKAIPVQKAWLDLQKDALSTLSAYAVAADGASSAQEKVDASTTLLNDSFLAGLPIIKDWIKAAEDEAQAHVDTTASLSKYRDVSLEARDAAAEAATATGDLTDETEDLAKAAADAEREIDDLADTISDDLFGRAIDRGNLADLRQTHKELLKQREEVEKGTPKWRILTGEIAENEQAQFDLQLQMKEKEGPHAVIEWLKRQKELFGDESGAIQRLIDKYKALASIQGDVLSAGNLIVGTGAKQGGNQYGGGKKRRASGGPVKADEAYIVGEEGQEVFVPDSNGRIIPNGGSGTPTWGGGATININVSTPALTPGAAQELGRTLMPIITRELQRTGHLTSARRF